MKDLSLAKLFFSKARGTGGQLQENLDPQDVHLVALKSDIAEHLPELSWKRVEKELDTKLGEVLNVGLDEVMLAAWKKYRGLCEYADSTRHPPEEAILVPLARHTVSSIHRPHVDLLIKDVSLGSLCLDIRLALALEGVVLKVQGGKIRDVCAGSCQVSGTLQCTIRSRVGSKEILSLKKGTRKLRLPGAVHLAHGVAIPAPGPLTAGPLVPER